MSLLADLKDGPKHLSDGLQSEGAPVVVEKNNSLGLGVCKKLASLGGGTTYDGVLAGELVLFHSLGGGCQLHTSIFDTTPKNKKNPSEL